MAETPKKSGAAKKAPAKKAPAKKAPYKKAAAKPGEVVLLSGDNPQIAMGYGNEPVEAYLAAIPGWKQDVARRLDELIEQTVPDVYRAVKWNSPFYGFEGQGWFLNMHCFTKYVKVTFFRGTSLQPLPPGSSKTPETRYYDVHEDDLDVALFTDWVRQASKLPGEML